MAGKLMGAFGKQTVPKIKKAKDPNAFKNVNPPLGTMKKAGRRGRRMNNDSMGY